MSASIAIACGAPGDTHAGGIKRRRCHHRQHDHTQSAGPCDLAVGIAVSVETDPVAKIGSAEAPEVRASTAV